MPPLHAILDTNVWISGVFWRGTPYQILRAWRDEQFELIYTPETLAEIESRLRRKAIEFGADLNDVRDWLFYIRTFAHIIAASGDVKGVCRDPKDDKFLDAAVTGKAEYLVAGDRDLLEIGEYQTVKIVSPRQFLDLLRAQPAEQDT